MSHEVRGLPADDYPIRSSGSLTARHVFDGARQARMFRYDLPITHPDPDVGEVLISVLTNEGDVHWGRHRPQELRLFRCFARFPVPNDDDQSGDWRLATFTYDITSQAGELAGKLSITDETTTFDFNREIAA